MNHKDRGHEPGDYRIKIAGHLDKSWSAWLNCTAIACETDENTQAPVTVLTCPITDQPALRGLLNKLFDLNLTVLSVFRHNLDADKNISQGTKK